MRIEKINKSNNIERNIFQTASIIVGGKLGRTCAVKNINIISNSIESDT